jgi:hypothetical protein
VNILAQGAQNGTYSNHVIIGIAQHGINSMGSHYSAHGFHSNGVTWFDERKGFKMMVSASAASHS